MIKYKGFTVVELILVITVIGIISSIVVVGYSGIQNSAMNTTVKTNLYDLIAQAEDYYKENGSYPAGLAQNGITGISNFPATKSAYDIVYDNLMYCRGIIGGVDTMGVAGQSKPGTKYAYNSTNGWITYSGTWSDNSSDIRTGIGIPPSTPGYSRGWGYNGDNGAEVWESWVVNQ